MKTIKVAAAVIKNNGNIFATQRGYGDYKDWWEFPGGKMEEGETGEQTVAREIFEELGIVISVGEKVGTVDVDYPDFHLNFTCYMAEIAEGEIVLKEHEDACWIGKEKLYELNWLPADHEMLKCVEKYL